MAINWRVGGIFVTGVLLGAAGAVALVDAGRDDGAATPQAAAAPAGVTQVAMASAPRVDCSFAPIVPAANREDGLLPLDRELQGRTAASVSTLILTGKEFAAAGKRRDAETAFLMACRSAEAVKDDAVPLADAHYQLARHYAQVAATPDVARREEMVQRAKTLYASSLQAFRAAKGEDHEKTRFARQGLETLEQAVAAPAPEPAMDAILTAKESLRAAELAKVAGAPPAPKAVPVAKAAPAVKAEPAVKVEPVAKEEPVVKVEAAAKAEPAPRPQPVARPDPDGAVEVTRVEPVPQPRRVRRAEPVEPPAEEAAPRDPAPAVEVISEPPATASGSAQ